MKTNNSYAPKTENVKNIFLFKYTWCCIPCVNRQFTATKLTNLPTFINEEKKCTFVKHACHYPTHPSTECKSFKIFYHYLCEFVQLFSKFL